MSSSCLFSGRLLNCSNIFLSIIETFLKIIVGHAYKGKFNATHITRNTYNIANDIWLIKVKNGINLVHKLVKRGLKTYDKCQEIRVN